MNVYAQEKKLLPAYPKTQHLPWKPNTTRDDAVALEDEAKVIFETPVIVEEKVDGASVGIHFTTENPIVRNRDHILNKGYVKKETTAKLQFRPLWTWVYEHKDRFKKLAGHGDYSVYGEWMLAQHGILYDKLPSWLIAYDLYDCAKHKFVGPSKSRELLASCGFEVVPLLANGMIENYEQLEELTKTTSRYTDSLIEGVYVRTETDGWLDKRFKMVRTDFVRGELWDNEEFKKNKLA
jgi:ATP-dependent RNA circularization protein (DNA/RNA ligase family)